MDLVGRVKAIESLLLGGEKVYVLVHILSVVRYGARTDLSKSTPVLN